ncbi:MAG: hypothetical protein M1368_02270 [Thaumarchaeota archaeon]|nr:hypothetical protein [Nitrososphaerota archaeon]
MSNILWMRGSAFSLTFYAFRDDEILRVEIVPSYSLYLSTLAVAILLWVWNPLATPSVIADGVAAFFISFIIMLNIFLLLGPFLQKRFQSALQGQLIVGRGRSKIRWSEISSISLWKPYRRIEIRTSQKKYSLLLRPSDLESVEDYIRSHSSAQWIMLSTRRNMIIAGVVLMLATFATLSFIPLFQPLAQSPFVALLSLFLTPVFGGLFICGLFVPKRDAL